MTSEKINSLLVKIKNRQDLNAKWYLILGLLIALLGGGAIYFSNYSIPLGVVLVGLGIGFASYARRLKQNNEIEEIMELLKSLSSIS